MITLNYVPKDKFGRFRRRLRRKWCIWWYRFWRIPINDFNRDISEKKLNLAMARIRREQEAIYDTEWQPPNLENPTVKRILTGRGIDWYSKTGVKRQDTLLRSVDQSE